jgi:hypothetical protein
MRSLRSAPPCPPTSPAVVVSMEAASLEAVPSLEAACQAAVPCLEAVAARRCFEVAACLEAVPCQAVVACRVTACQARARLARRDRCARQILAPWQPAACQASPPCPPWRPPHRRSPPSHPRRPRGSAPTTDFRPMPKPMPKPMAIQRMLVAPTRLARRAMQRMLVAPTRLAPRAQLEPHAAGSLPGFRVVWLQTSLVPVA